MLTSAAVSKAAKRQRQKERKVERQRIEASLARRRKALKIGAYIGAVAIIVAGTLVILRVSQGNDKKTAAGCVSPDKPPKDSPKLEVEPNKLYPFSIVTTEGTIDGSVNTCTELWGANNFVTLAKKDFYNNTSFHRVAKDFVIQGGDPNGDGTGGPGYTFVSELPTDGYAVGDLAWAKTGDAPPGSAGSQFFIITSDAALKIFNQQPYQYGKFGKVTNGTDVVARIAALYPSSVDAQGNPVNDGKPTKDVTITRVIIGEPQDIPATTTSAPTTTAAPTSSSAP